MNELAIVSKKELALEKAGATREAAYKAVVNGLTARKMTVDKFGEEHYEEDTTNQLRAAEIISKLNGDIKNETVIDNRQVHISVGKEDIKPLLEIVANVNAQLAALKASGRQTGEIIDITL